VIWFTPPGKSGNSGPTHALAPIDRRHDSPQNPDFWGVLRSGIHLISLALVGKLALIAAAGTLSR
jgi:hypothetical protein